MKSKPLKLELSEIISAGMKSLGYETKHPHSKKIFLKHAERVLSRLESGGTLLLKRGKNGALEAAVVISPGSMVGAYRPEKRPWAFEFFSKPGDRESLHWIKAQLPHLEPYLKYELEGAIFSWQVSLLPELKKFKIYATGLTLEGDVKRSLIRIKKKYGEKNLCFAPESGIQSVVPRSKKEIDEYLKIIKSEFSRNPQFGTFVAHPSFIEFLRKEFYKSLKKKQVGILLFKEAEKIIGGIEYSPPQRTLGGLQKVGVGLNFAKSHQRKGYAKIAYKIVLEELADRKIDLFGGGTSQIGVMKLGLVMERRLTGMHMQKLKRPFFDGGYMESWIQRFLRTA